MRRIAEESGLINTISINVLTKVGVLRNLGYIVWYFALICENSASANGNLDSSR